MNQKDDTIEVRQRELDRLCDKGFHFDITVRKMQYRTLWHKLLRRGETTTHTMRYTVLQPTLATIDRIAPLMLQLEPSMIRLRQADESTILEAAKTTLSDAVTLATILAHLVLGEEYYTPTPSGHWIGNDKDLAQTRDTLLHSVTPARMSELLEASLAVCNLADFIGSIRLIAAETQTASGRIE